MKAMVFYSENQGSNFITNAYMVMMNVDHILKIYVLYIVHVYQTIFLHIIKIKIWININEI